MFKQKIFRDANLQAEFEDNGYVRFPFLDAEEVAILKHFYNQNPSAFEKGFHPTMFHPSVDYRKMMDEKIRMAVAPKLPGLLNGYYPLYGNFMLKEPGEESAMKLHQDWTYVDETKTQSLAIWFPLQDLDDTNGVLQMVPGSHRINNIIRGPGIFEPYHEVHDYLIENCLESIYLKAGEAIVWDHRVLHCSPANLSHQKRISVTAILIPEGEEVFHCYQADDAGHTQIEKFKVDNAFFMNYEIGKKPLGVPSLGFKEYVFPALSLDKFQSLLNMDKRTTTS